jgi:hypothetical protein
MKKIYCLEFGKVTVNGQPAPGMALVEADSPEEAKANYKGKGEITGVHVASEREIIWAHELKLISDKYWDKFYHRETI